MRLCNDGCTAEFGDFKRLLDQGVDPNVQYKVCYCNCYYVVLILCCFTVV